MDIPADWTPSQRFLHAPIWDKHNFTGISVLLKHCVAGNVSTLAGTSTNMLNSPFPSCQSMRIFVFLALREAQALLAKSLAPSQTPGEQKLRWLAKAETVASIVFVCGRCFTPNLNQLQNSERFYIPYNLTIPHCLKPTLLLLYPFFLNLSWIQPAPQPHPDSFLPPPCTARVWLSSRSINASPAFGTPNPGKISLAIIEFEGVSAVQGDWKCLLVHVSGWRWLHGCIPTKALRLVICRKSGAPPPNMLPWIPWTLF